MPEKSPQQHVNELKELVVGYAKQETVGPLKGLGRVLGFGIAGGLCIATGIGFLAIALLRLLQTELPEALDGHGKSSWFPYLAVVVLLGAGAGISAKAATRKKDSK